MLSWVSLNLGRKAVDAPDACCFLHKNYLHSNEAFVKNIECWLYQRDTISYKTEPAVKIQQVIKMWMVQPEMYYDYI